jgi:glycosyltransferase involved in cell wall biosynthesis
LEIIKLSICIATHNRADFITHTLKSILDQATDEVEVIIVDGASTDNTEALVRSIQVNHSQLEYYYLDKKGGVDQDFCHAVSLAKGKFCWLFSDDDLLKPGAIAAVINEINKDEYSMILVNSEWRNLDMITLYRERHVPLLSDKIFNSSAQGQQNLLAEMGDYLSFIGCVVIEREEWNKREKTTYFGTAFVHLGVIFQSFLPKNTLFISYPFISIRLGNAQWTNAAFNIWIISWPKLIWSLTHFPDEIKQRVISRTPAEQLWKLFYYRAMGTFSFDKYKSIVKPYSNSGIKLLLARLISVLPGGLTNAFFIAYAKIRGRYWMLIELKKSQFYKSKLKKTNG